MSAHGYVQVGEHHPEEPSAKKDAPPQLLRPTKSKAEQIAAIKAKVRRSTHCHWWSSNRHAVDDHVSLQLAAMQDETYANAKQAAGVGRYKPY
jgi:hypothetical protein